MPEISIPGDPSGLAGLASQLGAAADHVDTVHGRVASEGLNGSWSGNAANAFRSTLNTLPAELAKVVQAFGDAGRSISSFSSTLSQLQQKATWYNRQLEGAHQELADAEARRYEAQSELRAAQLRHDTATDPVSLHAARDAVSLGESMVGQAAAHVEDSLGRIAKLEAASRSLRDEYDHAVGACCAALDAVRHSGGNSILGTIAAHLKSMGEFVEHGGAAIWRGAEELGEDFEAGLEAELRGLDEHWGNWRALLVTFNEVFGEELTALAAALPVLALAALEIPVVGEIAAPIILAVDEGVQMGGKAIQIVDSAVILGGDYVEGRRGRSEYRDKLPEDAVRFGFSLVPDGKVVGGLAGKAGRELESIPAVRNSVPTIRNVTTKFVSKMEGHFGHDLAHNFLADEGKAAAKKVMGQAEDWTEDIVDRLPRAVISPPLESPLQFQVPLPALVL